MDDAQVVSEKSQFLTEDELLGWDDIQERELQIPEWGNRKVRVRALTMEQMADLAAKSTRPSPRRGEPDTIDREMSVILTVAYGLVEPAIKRENIGRIKTKHAGAITRIVQAINELGPTATAIDEAAKSDAPELNGSISVFPGAGVEKN